MEPVLKLGCRGKIIHNYLAISFEAPQPFRCWFGFRLESIWIVCLIAIMIQLQASVFNILVSHFPQLKGKDGSVQLMLLENLSKIFYTKLLEHCTMSVFNKLELSLQLVIINHSD